MEIHNHIYLDHNATTSMRPEARDAVLSVLETTGNPSSIHMHGRRARSILEQSRASIANFVNAANEDVIFTSGGTEANNLALLGCNRPRKVVSAVEHSSILNGGNHVIKVDKNGIIDFGCLEELLEERTSTIVSVMLANNETGVIQPIKEIATLAHRYGALIHCDAVQAAGKIPIDIVELGVDMLSLSAHKIGGLAGVGALVAPGIANNIDCNLRCILFGGGQERGYRSGTENLAGIAGFSAAANAAQAGLNKFAELSVLRNYIDKSIKTLEPEVKILASDADRLPNTSCVIMPGIDSDTQVMAFDLAGVAVSAGSACSSGKTKFSHVLKAMGLSEEISKNALRVSLGWSSVKSDADVFIRAWQELYERLSMTKINLPAA